MVKLVFNYLDIENLLNRWGATLKLYILTRVFKKTVINQNKTPTNHIAGNSMIDSVQQMLEQRRAAIDSGEIFF